MTHAMAASGNSSRSCAALSARDAPSRLGKASPTAPEPAPGRRERVAVPVGAPAGTAVAAGGGSGVTARRRAWLDHPMVFEWSHSSRRPALGSALADWLERITPHPDTFVCGVRRPDGDGTRGSQRWRYRRAWVDPLRLDDVVTLRFGGDRPLRVRLAADPLAAAAEEAAGPAPRPRLVVLSGASADSGDRLCLAVPAGELVRFGIDQL